MVIGINAPAMVRSSEPELPPAATIPAFGPIAGCPQREQPRQASLDLLHLVRFLLVLKRRRSWTAGHPELVQYRPPFSGGIALWKGRYRTAAEITASDETEKP